MIADCVLLTKANDVVCRLWKSTLNLSNQNNALTKYQGGEIITFFRRCSPWLHRSTNILVISAITALTSRYQRAVKEAPSDRVLCFIVRTFNPEWKFLGTNRIGLSPH